MKFSFEKLGPIENGEIEISDLTVVCGCNNSGKTYLTYALYGFLRNWLMHVQLPSIAIEPLRQSGVMEIDLAPFIKDSQKYIKAAIREYSEDLHSILASQDTHFINSRLDLEVLINSTHLAKAHNQEMSTEARKRLIGFSKPENSTVLKVTAALNSSDAKERFPYQNLIRAEIIKLVFEPMLPRPFIASAERTGAVMFSGELNLQKNRLISFASKLKENQTINPFEIIDSVYGAGYPLPVTDNIDFINTLSTIDKSTSPLLKLHPSIITDFEDVIGGVYKLGREGDIRFLPKSRKSLRLRMGESSSAVRALVILGFYLKHKAAPGDLLMIDEPELNLHPKNQRKLARLLARLVKHGIKVFVTTHSDYIVKEFNILIAMSNPDVSDKLKESLGYTNDYLNPEKSRLYMLGEKRVNILKTKKTNRAMPIQLALLDPEVGFKVDTFDSVIQDMTDIENQLYWNLEEKNNRE